MVEKEEELEQAVEEKQVEEFGITETVNAEGQTVITANLFEKGTYDHKYNGVYVIGRIEVQHNDLWANLVNQSKNATGIEDNITDGAQEIVKGRKGQNIQVKHIMAMLKNEGVDPEGKFEELNDKEKMILNIKASKGMDMAQVYGDMAELLNRLIVKSPEKLKLESKEDWNHFQPALGKELFDRSMSLLMSKFSIKKGLKKK